TFRGTEGPVHIDAEARIERVRAPGLQDVERHRRHGRSGLQAGFDEELEGAGAMRERRRIARLPAVLFLRAHLAEGHFVALGLEDGIVAEAFFSARRPDDPALDLAAEELRVPVRPGEAEDGDEACRAR